MQLIDFYDYTTGEFGKNLNRSRIERAGPFRKRYSKYTVHKLFAPVNCSHFVEVMDLKTARHIGSVNITNCRYIQFHEGEAHRKFMPVRYRLTPMPVRGKL